MLLASLKLKLHHPFSPVILPSRGIGGKYIPGSTTAASICCLPDLLFNRFTGGAGGAGGAPLRTGHRASRLRAASGISEGANVTALNGRDGAPSIMSRR